MDLFNYFLSDLPGAPQLQRQPGSLIEVLDAALVTGLGLTVVNQISAAAGVVTIKVTGAPVALPQGLIELAGVGGALAGLNGVHRVQEVGADTITIHAAVADAQSTAAGMTVRIPPLGWRKKFADGAVAVYDSEHAQWFGHCLQVDTSAATSGSPAKWRGYHSMSDAHTGIDPFPGLEAEYFQLINLPVYQDSGRWCVLGDGAFFALGVESYESATRSNLSWACFGRLDAVPAGDAGCVIQAPQMAQYSYRGGLVGLVSGVVGMFMAVPGGGASSPAAVMPGFAWEGNSFSGRGGWLGSRSGVDASGLLVDLPCPVVSAPLGASDVGGDLTFRGLLPGLRHIAHHIDQVQGGSPRFLFEPFQVVRAGGRTLLFVPQVGNHYHINYGDSYYGFFVDITGWRAGL
ncbi:hypothetical protein CK623_11390 [Vandammella animalimorsus]|uniref:Uncharacterized protein n=1 Tax=Vandammella animalimorsus TaxID=2029117 RepID=A0A2A2ANG1_9BURK|nr:hypothetical protein [Vandammella animalimorsus]PAT39159.1 hypothetical protein CK623_11390 [Vandammella animalimorsus]